MKELNRVKGLQGEQIACEYLKKKRYKIIERNYKNKLGEIDIIAQKKKTTVFVEVKARETASFGRPSEAVDEVKQEKIRRTAMYYLVCNKKTDTPVRFDVLEILGEEINHIENAF